VLVPACSKADSSGAPSASPTGGSPNVLLVIADDFGIDESPCYDIGDHKAEMPNLHHLCDNGVVFENVWVNPMCTPTRAAMLTGQYGFRTNVLQVHDVLADDVPTLQDALTTLPTPYANAVIGKWHVSGDRAPPDAPGKYGVEHYAGFLGGDLGSYFDWDYVEDGQPSHTDEYSTSWITDKAIGWIGEQQAHPWFLWLAYNAPHWPYHLPPSELTPAVDGLSGSVQDIEAQPLPYVLAMAQALDTEMGRLFDSIDPSVLARTTIVFIGDNGSEREVAQPPFSAEHAKYSIYEGGVRAPLVVAGAGVTRHGEREDALVNGVDVTATIARLAGYENTSFHDGVSFDQALSDSSFKGRDFIYTDSIRAEPFDGQPGWAVREGQYKLIEFDSGVHELYDVVADPGETTDLIRNGVPTDLEQVVGEMEAYQASL
jgi:arylsulfatase A-like enzyme